MARIFTSADQLIGKTPLLELTHLEQKEQLSARILAKLEFFNPAGSAKDRVALRMILDAEERGLLKPGATVIINTTKDVSAFPVEGDVKVITVDATGLALDILGRPITNVPLLGALIAATGMVKLEAVESAIDDQLAPKIREKNKVLLHKTYEIVKEGM